MHTTAHFTNPEHTLSFLLAGNARITMQSEKTGTRYTCRVRLAEPKEGQSQQALWFVSLLTGSDNESDYTYMGMITPCPETGLSFRTTKASKYRPDSTPVLAFSYVLKALAGANMPKGVALNHEGRCGRCGRTLTVPESVASGIGPECALKLAA